MDDIQKKYSLSPANTKSFADSRILEKAKLGVENYKKYYSIYQKYEETINLLNAALQKNDRCDIAYWFHGNGHGGNQTGRG